MQTARVRQRFVARIFFFIFVLCVWSLDGRAEAAIINEPMTGATAPNWVIGGSAYLTAGTGIDPVGSGWLRLTPPLNNQAGYGFLNTPFDISSGVVIQFDYATWGGNGADGYSIYLFDAMYDASNYSAGASGGSLGYDKKTIAPLDPGLTGGYIGVGIDEYGNYSNQTEGRVDLAPLGPGSGFFPNEVGVRGPEANQYEWLGGSGGLAQQLSFNGQTYRPIQTGVQYRKVVIYLTPQAAPDYLRVDVYLQFGYNQPLTSVVTGLMVGQPIPASVKIGYAASTGGSTNYHEIRNLVVDYLSTDINLAMVKTAAPASVAQGGALTYTLTARNYGPNLITATNAPITDTFPAWLTGVAWTCVASGGGASCGAAGGAGDINSTATLPFNTSVTYTVTSTVNPVTPLGTQLVNTALITAPAGVTDYNLADNSSTATVSVTGPLVTVSGMVYSDSGAGGGIVHNGIKDGTEGSTAVANIYAKLFRSSDLTTALQAVLIPAAAGTITFNNVPSYDTYTIILSTNNTLTDPTPGFPSANWVYTAPLNYTLSNIAVAGVNVTNQNLGVYNGSRVSGIVLRDNGLNGALSNANDGILNGGGTGITGVTVSLRNNTGVTTYDTTITGAGGSFVLFTNTASANLRIYETNSVGYISVNFNAGTTAGAYTMAGEYIQFAYVLYTDYNSVIFSDVDPNTFTPTPLASSGSATAPVWYAHTFTQGSGGTVAFTTFSRTQGTWPAVAYFKDVNCNGVYDGGDIAMPASITAVVNTQTCVLVRETIPSSALNGTTDAIVTRATFSYINSLGPVVVTHDVTDTTTVIASDVSNSTKSWADPNGGDQDPLDVIQYTITVIETAGNPASGVTVTDTLPVTLTAPVLVSCPPGATCNFVGQTLTVTNVSVPANGSVTIVFNTTISAGMLPGDVVNNCATVVNPGGPDTGPCALSITATIVISVSQIPGSGAKKLYLYGAAGYQLSRTPTPGVPAAITLAKGGGSQVWTQSPVLQLPVTLSPLVSAGFVPVSLYLASNVAANRTIVVSLVCSGGGTVLTQTMTLALPLAPAATLQTFLLPIAAVQTCAAGNTWNLTVQNTSAGGGVRNVLVYPVVGANISNVSLPSLNVINVNSVNPYNAAYPAVTTPLGGVYGTGATVYVRAVVSDPFGSFDINATPPTYIPTVTIKDPNNVTVILSAAMTQMADSGLATKTFEYAYVIPVLGPVGFWTTTVTAKEGTENTVSDTGVGTFHAEQMPSIMIMKTVQTISDPISIINPKAIPGATMLYTVYVQNSGYGSVDSGTTAVTDAIPANTAMCVSNICSNPPVTFACSAVPPCGLIYNYATDVAYSSAAGGVAPFTYAPVPDGAGYDAVVTGVRINPGGVLAGSGVAPYPNFSLFFKVRVK